MSEFMQCEVCRRLIRVEHGPVCVFCQGRKPRRRVAHPHSEAEPADPGERTSVDDLLAEIGAEHNQGANG